MQQAWAMSEGRNSWWRRAFAPPGLAWAGAAAGLVLIASVVVWGALQQPGGFQQVFVQSAIDGKSSVALQQPILVSFNQPMDHQTTQAAVQITPATNVTFAWDQNSRTLAVLAPDGASSPAISPAGDRLAYIRGGRIEALTFAAGKTDEIKATPAATLVGWAKDKLVWAAADGIYTEAPNGQSQLAPLPSSGEVTVLSIAPDGVHAIYRQDQKLFVLDLTTAKSTQLVQTKAAFAGCSPGGAFLLYSTADAIVVADPQGVTQATLPAGEASWSTQHAILLGSDTELDQDGSD